MTRKRKPPVVKSCENCGEPFETRRPARARFCPGSKCRSEFWDKRHRVADVEALAREALRAHWRAEWRRNGRARRARRRESGRGEAGA